MAIHSADRLADAGQVTDLLSLPPGLPVPTDDGAATHLAGSPLAAVALASTASRVVTLAHQAGPAVVYCYPRTGRPGEAIPPEWEGIPGARGCTVEACGFRDHYRELISAGAAAVFGLSTQMGEDQSEAARRLHLPFELLSDADLAFADEMRLPTFEFGGRRLLRRLTMVIEHGQVEHVFYPIFPPDQHPGEVLSYLRRRQRRTNERA